MEKSLDQIIDELPAKRRERIEKRSSDLTTLKDLRLAVELTQEELTANPGFGQDTISRT